MRRYSSRTPATLWLVALLLTGACGGEPVDEAVEGPVTDTTYVAVITDLLLLDADPPRRDTPEESAVAADSSRSEILDEHGVTAEEVLTFAESAGREPGRMQELWEQITHVYDSSRAARLRAQTEARSESEAKLGTDARNAAGGESAGGVKDSLARVPVSRRPVPALRDSLMRSRQSKQVPKSTRPE